jgi:predicted lipoprotein with Yx(FWY)xxD motif
VRPTDPVDEVNPFRAASRTADQSRIGREGHDMLGTGTSAPRRRTALVGSAAAAVIVGALFVSTISPSSAGAVAKPRTATTISTEDDAELGRVLVAGTTLYALKPSKSPCTAACMRAWTPVLLPHGVKRPNAGAGVDASKLGAVGTKRGRQVTYSGKRLYWFAHDTAADGVHGTTRNKWGTWSAVVVTAPPSTSAAPASPSTTAVPQTDAPTIAPPVSAPPATEAPATAPPATEAPPTAPPTEPPTTRPPSTTNPGTGGVAF